MTTTTTQDVDLFSLEGDALAEKFGTTKEQLEEAQAVLQLVQSAAKRIKTMREHKGMSRAALGELLGVTEQRVAQLESGTLRNAASLKTIAKAAYHLDCVSYINFEPKAPEPKAGYVSCGWPAQATAVHVSAAYSTSTVVFDERPPVYKAR